MQQQQIMLLFTARVIIVRNAVRKETCILPFFSFSLCLLLLQYMWFGIHCLYYCSCLVWSRNGVETCFYLIEPFNSPCTTYIALCFLFNIQMWKTYILTVLINSYPHLRWPSNIMLIIRCLCFCSEKHTSLPRNSMHSDAFKTLSASLPTRLVHALHVLLCSIYQNQNKTTYFILRYHPFRCLRCLSLSLRLLPQYEPSFVICSLCFYTRHTNIKVD